MFPRSARMFAARTLLLPGSRAQDVEAMMRGRVVQVIEVMPVSVQVTGGGPFTPKASTCQVRAPNEVGSSVKEATNRSGLFTGDHRQSFRKAESQQAMTAERTPGNHDGEDAYHNGTFSTYRSTTARTKPNGGSRSPSRKNKNTVSVVKNERTYSMRGLSKVAMQTILGACARLTTGSAIVGGVAVLLGGAMVDAAQVLTDATCEDASACDADASTCADSSKWLFLAGLVSATVTFLISTFTVLSAVREFDETAQYVYRHALPYWQGLVGMVDFMLARY